MDTASMSSCNTLWGQFVIFLLRQLSINSASIDQSAPPPPPPPAAGAFAVFI